MQWSVTGNRAATRRERAGAVRGNAPGGDRFSEPLAGPGPCAGNDKNAVPTILVVED
jgi:hypothetical protein